MKNINRWPFLILSLGFILFTGACTKDKHPAGTASLTVINAVAGADMLVANFNGSHPMEWYANASMLQYGAYYNDVEAQYNNQFNAYSGKLQLALFRYPDTLAQDQPLVNLPLNIPAGSINSLFLTGTAAAPDTLFTTDHPPYHPIADSSMGVRFVNLSPGAGPISINLQGQAPGSEAGNLPYKGITGFRNYAVVSSVSSYVFEFRNAVDGALLATYAAEGIYSPDTDNFPNRWSHKNVTLAFYGLPSQQAVLCINNN